jgi:hypothetical protein
MEAKLAVPHMSRNSINENDGPSSGPSDSFGGREHLSRKGYGKSRKFGYSSETNKLDRPTIASDARAKRSASDECFPLNSHPYGGPSRRDD